MTISFMAWLGLTRFGYFLKKPAKRVLVYERTADPLAGAFWFED